MKSINKYFKHGFILVLFSIITSLTACKKKSDWSVSPDKNISDNTANKIVEFDSSSLEEKNTTDGKNIGKENAQKTIVPAPLGMPQDTMVRQLIEKYNNPDGLSKSDILNQLLQINSEESLRGVFHLTQGMPPGEFKIEICQKILDLNIYGKEDFFIGALPTLDQEMARAISQVLGLHANHDLIEKLVIKYDNENDSKNKALLLSVIENSSVPAAVHPLTSLLSDPDSSIDDELIYSSAKALAKNGSAPSVSALLSKINSAKGKHEIEQLDNIITNIYEPESEQALIYGALGNKDTSNTQARIASIKALANYQTQQTRDALQKLKSDPDPVIRENSLNSLEKF